MTIKAMACTASIVRFNNSAEDLMPSINSYLNTPGVGLLYLVDNSPLPLDPSFFSGKNIAYLFNNANLGFGAGHNRAINLAAPSSDFHLILNPDVAFTPDVLLHLIAVLRKNPSIGAIMPRVNYMNGTLQKLCKLLPTPLTLIIRRFIPVESIRCAINKNYELSDLPQHSLVEVPCLSGCFLLVQSKILLKEGGFDARYFMYMEDVDLIRRIGLRSQVMYDPRVSIFHGYSKASYKSLKLMVFHVLSACKYFNRWGWFVDSQRTLVNRGMKDRLKKFKIR